jgi:hypothetical protein
MKKWFVFLFFFPFLLGLILTGCASNPAVELVQTQTSMPTQLPLVATATPTPTLIGALPPGTKEPPSKLTGKLEVRFPHPFGGQPEFCDTFVPYQLTLTYGTYILTGEGDFDCLQSETVEGGVTLFLEQHYKITLAGSLALTPGSPLIMGLRMTGNQKVYYEMPPQVPETFTAENPFDLDIDQPLKLQFKYDDEANCLWNDNGTFCSLEGEQGLLEESGWLFILHPDD